MKSNRPLVITTVIAHALAWAAFLAMVFLPTYSGTKTTPIGPDGSGGDVVPLSATMIEINGWGVLIPLSVPVILTGIGLVGSLTWRRNWASKALLWIPAIILLGFCALAIFSIGMFYLPAALALLVAAIIAAVRGGGMTRTPATA